MKKVLNLLLIILMGFVFISCNGTSEDTKPKLKTPIVSYSNETITWNEVAGADRYTIRWDEGTATTTETQFSLADFSDGTYYFRIKATTFSAEKDDSDYSRDLQVIISGHDLPPVIEEASFAVNSTKTSLQVGDVVTISVVKNHTTDDYALSLSSGASSYVSLNGHELTYHNPTSGEVFITITATSVIDSSIKGEISLTLLPPSTINYPTGQVNVFTMNDTHGAFNQETTPGIDQVASVIEELEQTNGAYIKIANGDIFQGGYVSNIHYGKPLMEALNDLNYDCFVIGNHEFDWGIDKIHAYKDGDYANGEANYPFLGANITYKSTGERLEWLDPYVIVDYNGVKVGIIGFIGDTLESSIGTDYVKDYEFVDPVPLIESYASYLRMEEDCDVIIASGHVYDQDLNTRIASLGGTSKVDLILCGHSHQLIHDKLNRSDGKKIAAVQCNDKNANVTSVILKLNQNNEYNSYEYQIYYPSNYTGSITLESLMDKYLFDINESTRIVGYAPYLSKARIGEICLQAMKEQYDCDINIINTGGVRRYHSAGNLTVGEIYEIYPFSNHIYLTSMSGSALKSLIDKNGSYLYYDLTSISTNKTYSVCVIDYVYTGTYYTQFNGTTYRDTGVLLRDLLVQKLDDMYN